MIESSSAATALLRPNTARGLLLVGVLGALIPLSRRAPRQQAIRLELPSRVRGSSGKVEVSYTRDGESEPLGGYTLAFPGNAPASLRREISAPDGKYRLDILLEGGRGAGDQPCRIEIARQVSLSGAEVRVFLEEASP